MLEGLTDTERGVVLGALLAGEGGAGPLARLTGAGGARCVAAFRRASQTDGGLRRRWIRELVAEVLAPVPRELAQVHPSWVAALLEEEPEELRAAVWPALSPGLQHALEALRPKAVRDLPAPLRLALCRGLLGPLGAVDLSAGDEVPEVLRGLHAWDAERLARALARLGVLVLAAFGRLAGAAAVAEVAELGGRLDETAQAELARAHAAAELPPVKGFVPFANGRPPTSELLACLAAEWLGWCIPDELALPLALRLPRAIGRFLVADGREAQVERNPEPEPCDEPARPLAIVAAGWLQTADGGAPTGGYP
ncbi:MAG: hypothetical protein IT371_04890 [Deltaproteobacteria bacterium]|nr:hypothetical protein [Deltaproteobacteria bacterium]